MCFVQFLAFLRIFFQRKSLSSLAIVNKNLMPVGVYREITDRLLTNQSARTIAAI